MSCSRYRQLISRYVDDEVTPRQRADLLAHVQVCPDCAAWLARTRHTDVLLKGVNQTKPSDRVRNAILSEIRAHNPEPRSTASQAAPAKPALPASRKSFGSLRLASAGLLLRFDPSPARIIAGLGALLLVLVALAFYFNLLPPVWSYNKLGFEYQPDTQATLDTTPIPIHAVTSGQGGVGGPVAVPNPVSMTPAEGTHSVGLDTPLRIRFDQPMDRASVEGALTIDPPAAGVFGWDADNEVHFTPASPGLLRGITYTVALTTTALSMAGTPLKQKVTWSFQTLAPHSVTALPPDGASIAPSAAFGLQFDVPMQPADAAAVVSLRAATTNSPVGLTYGWDTGGTLLAIRPEAPLPEGYYYLRVADVARTQAGETLGRSFEYRYHVQVPGRNLQLPGERVMLAAQGSPIEVRYQADNPARFSPSGLSLAIYALPAEQLSALGAQANRDDILPVDFPGSLQLLQQTPSVILDRSGTIQLPALSAGIYLLVAPSAPDASAADWKMLVVSDGHLALTGSNSPLWATDQVGRAWASAEVSLYSPDGALLEKGLTDGEGLWQPSAAGNGASLAVARDLGGHVAATLVDASTVWGTEAADALPASLVTDLPAYRPGSTVGFHVTLQARQGDQATTSASDRDISVLLLTPAGSPVASLILKPDGVGGVSGLFPLSADAQPGLYTISVRSDGARHDFPLRVVPATTDTLSVYIVPATETEVSTTITRTVSVLGPDGQPAVGAQVTARLAILGDGWTSDAVNATTNSDGRATLVASLPDWFARFNDPGLYLSVQVAQGALRGSATSYLDLTAQRATISGMTQLVAPGFNLAVVSRPAADGSFKVRLVLIDQLAPEGDILVEALSPSGDRETYSLDMARLLDATLNIPQRYAGGSLTVRATGKPGSRTLTLMPAQNPEASLRVIVPYSLPAGSAIPVRLGLTNLEGVGVAGSASLWLRPVSSDATSEGGGALEWKPSVALNSNGTLTTTLQAPNTPGLWYVMAQAATPGGNFTTSWGVVRITPGLWVQLPPVSQATAGEPHALLVVVHNPSADAVSTGLRASPQGGTYMVGADSQPVDVPSGGWERLDWRVLSGERGVGQVAFSFMPSSGTGGSWPLNIPTDANTRTNTTYTSGVLSGERTVGVAVPWGLSDESIRLEVRVSNSLLPALAGIATDLRSATDDTHGVSLAAARLSAPSSVASAYARLNSTLPSGLALSGVERSLLLQQLYSAQHADGGWGYTLDGAGISSVGKTAEVLLAFHRLGAFAGGDAAVAPDPSVINRAVSFLSTETDRPLGVQPASEALDERAFGLYVVSLYSTIPGEPVRAMLAYASSALAEHGLSTDGQAWLALALWQTGNSADAVALLDHLLVSEQDAPVAASAPLLDALVVGLQSMPAGVRSPNLPDYQAYARRNARAIMEARQGAGWSTPSMTADALWALSHYAAAEGEAPRGNADLPTLVLSDRQVQAATVPGLPGTLSAILSGAELRPGTNWLKLKSSSADQVMYYSLTLIATR